MRPSLPRMVTAAGLTGLAALLLFSSCLRLPVQAQANKRLEEVTKSEQKSDKAQEPRLALVIGNGDYKGNLLKNPVNDARAMAALLKKQGFVVMEKENATLTEMQDAIRAFGEKLESTPGAVALFYFSGHGLQAGGQNWLVPIAHGIHGERDVPDKAVSAQRVLDQMAGGRLNILILDACRDNPFIPEKKSLGKGLAKMDAPSGTLIAYATAPGKTADDNPDEANGLYTQELLKQMQTPGLDLPKVFIQTRVQVKKRSKGQQVPWEEGALETTDFYFVPPTNRPNKVDNGDEVTTQMTLTLTSDPPGAHIFIDGQDTGKTTPATLPYDLGLNKTQEVEIGFRQAGYQDAARKVRLQRGQPLTLKTVALFKRVNPRPHKDDDNGNLPRTKTDRVGAEMILIPAGPFEMGDDDRKDNPRHTVTLSGYYLYKNLVTVGQYERFLASAEAKQQGLKMPPAPDFNPNWEKKDHPIVRVTWEAAGAYCKWVGGHLPTEAQWEKAARGTMGLKYPWGNAWDASKVWSSKGQAGGAGGTTAVDRFGVSPYGCTDMAGNVWQWCADWYDENFWSGRSVEGRTDPQNQSIGKKEERVLRGGSWFSTYPVYFRAAYRAGSSPAFPSNINGFRAASGL